MRTSCTTLALPERLCAAITMQDSVGLSEVAMYDRIGFAVCLRLLPFAYVIIYGNLVPASQSPEFTITLAAF